MSLCKGIVYSHCHKIMRGTSCSSKSKRKYIYYQCNNCGMTISENKLEDKISIINQNFPKQKIKHNVYPNNSLYIVLKSSNTVPESAVDIKLGPNGNSGTFIVAYTYGGLIENIPICNIDSITIENATYNNEITYLPAPVPLPPGCSTDCDESIRKVLPVGTANVNIFTTARTAIQENIIKNEYGMIVLENTEKMSIAFISSCRMEVANLSSSNKQIYFKI